MTAVLIVAAVVLLASLLVSVGVAAMSGGTTCPTIAWSTKGKSNEIAGDTQRGLVQWVQWILRLRLLFRPPVVRSGPGDRGSLRW